jgi:hypothetical protein
MYERAEDLTAELRKATRGLLVDQVTAEVVAALDAADIASILLKGPSIARWLYPAGGRSYRDTDLLVRARDFARAETILKELGFVNLVAGLHPIEIGTGLEAETPYGRLRGPGHPGGKVDLHRNLPGWTTPPDLLWATFTAESETMKVAGTEVRILNHTAVALHVVDHAVQHGFRFHTDEDLRRVLATLSLADWQAVAELARRLAVADILDYGLRRHAAGIAVADRLDLPPLALVDSPFRWSNVGGPPGAISFSVLIATPGWRAKGVRILSTIFPSPAWIRRSSGHPQAHGRTLVFAYLQRWRHLARRSVPAARYVFARRRQDSPEPGPAASVTNSSRRRWSRQSRTSPSGGSGRS